MLIADFDDIIDLDWVALPVLVKLLQIDRYLLFNLVNLHSFHVAVLAHYGDLIQLRLDDVAMSLCLVEYDYVTSLVDHIRGSLLQLQVDDWLIPLRNDRLVLDCLMVLFITAIFQLDVGCEDLNLPLSRVELDDRP